MLRELNAPDRYVGYQLLKMIELYGAQSLPLGEFRLISIHPLAPGQNSQTTLTCSLGRFSRSDYNSASLEDPGDNSRVWPGAGEFDWENLGLFQPRSKVKPGRPTPLVRSATESQSDLSDKYLALSYVWGPPTPTRTVVINGSEVHIGANLHAALVRLRESDWVRKGIKVWADAISINQGDLTEKGGHIGTMNQVYAEAWQVIIWLGPQTDHTPKAYGAITWLAREIGTDAKMQEFVSQHEVGSRYHVTTNSIKAEPGFVWLGPVYLALRDFFANTYWHRLWILQELAMSREDAPVLWGEYTITLRDMHTAAKLIEAYEERLGSRISSTSEIFDPMQSYIVSNDRQLGNPHGRPDRLWRRLLHIMDVRAHQNERQQYPARRETVISTIELARKSGATDSRDKVFGLLGISSISQLTDITPDYYANIKDVFTSFTEELISRGDLTMLRLIHGEVGGVRVKWTGKTFFSKQYRGASAEWVNEDDVPEEVSSGRGKYLTVAPPCPHELPSWTMCLICSPAPFMYLPKEYKADAGLTGSKEGDDRREGEVLRVSGVFIDTVATLSAFNLSEADTSYPHNSTDPNPTPNAYDDLPGLRDALWHTIVADSVGDGSEDAPAGWDVLLNPKLWAAASPYSPRTIGLEFSLATFMMRNKHLRLGGHELHDVIFGGGSGKLKQARAALDGLVTQRRKDAAEALLTEARLRAANVLAWRRLVGTRRGRIGLSVAAARDGDSIAVLKGCGMPMVLRPAGEGLWKVVGECYVHGVMKGEVAEWVRRGEAEMTGISLG